MVTLASPDAPRRRSPLERLAVTSQVHGVSGCGNKRSGQLRASSKIFPLFDTVNVQFKIRWWGLGILNGNDIVFLPLGWCGRCCLSRSPPPDIGHSLTLFVDRSVVNGLCTSRLQCRPRLRPFDSGSRAWGSPEFCALLCLRTAAVFSHTRAPQTRSTHKSQLRIAFVVLKLGRCARLLKSFGSVIREMIRYEVPTHVGKVSRRVG